MSVDGLSEGEIEAQLARLARSKLSASALQPRVAALRAISGAGSASARPSSVRKRDRARQEHRAEQDSTGGEDEATRLAWLSVDIGPDMAAALGYPPGPRRATVPPAVMARIDRDADRILADPDPRGQWEKWKAAHCPPK
jgi:hypothetical protein